MERHVTFIFIVCMTLAVTTHAAQPAAHGACSGVVDFVKGVVGLGPACKWPAGSDSNASSATVTDQGTPEASAVVEDIAAAVEEEPAAAVEEEAGVEVVEEAAAAVDADAAPGEAAEAAADPAAVDADAESATSNTGTGYAHGVVKTAWVGQSDTELTVEVGEPVFIDMRTMDGVGDWLYVMRRIEQESGGFAGGYVPRTHVAVDGEEDVGEEAFESGEAALESAEEALESAEEALESSEEALEGGEEVTNGDDGAASAAADGEL